MPPFHDLFEVSLRLAFGLVVQSIVGTDRMECLISITATLSRPRSSLLTSWRRFENTPSSYQSRLIDISLYLCTFCVICSAYSIRYTLFLWGFFCFHLCTWNLTQKSIASLWRSVAIVQFGFRCSNPSVRTFHCSLPVILSIENHCKLPQQRHMAAIFCDVFKGKTLLFYFSLTYLWNSSLLLALNKGSGRHGL